MLDWLSRRPCLARLARWRTLRWLPAVAGLPIVWACGSHPLEQPRPSPIQQTDVYYDVSPTRDVDVLFVIDNSPSMGEEQDSLRASFPRFMDRLQEIPGRDGRPTLPDVRIGVVSTDLGAGPTAISQCNRPGGDKAELRVAPGCGIDADARYLVSSNNGTSNNFTGSIGDAFSCIAKLGVQGCGYEHQLLSTLLALAPRPELSLANVGFLRPDAHLVVIIITDEDDCSAPLDTDLFSSPQEIPGQTSSVRCALKGHLCNGKEIPAAEFSAPMSSCESNDRGKLLSVSDLVAEVEKLKPGRPERIMVRAITGIPDPAGEYRITRDANGDLDYKPACSSAIGKATPALRIKKFVDAFGPGGLYSICEGDLSRAMDDIGGDVIGILECVGDNLVDTDPDADGLQPDCRVTDRRTQGTDEIETPVPACAPGQGPPCWRLAESPTCGYRMEVNRDGAVAPPGTYMAVKCLTCARRGTPGCP